jgi:hypothetical protein
LIYVLSKFADAWRVESEKEIISLEFETISFDGFDFEITMIDDKAYLYFLFETSPVGSAFNEENYHFSMVSLTDLTMFELVYNDNHISDEQDFINIEDLKDKPIILKYLEEKAAKSKFVYKPTKEDLDMDNPKNYEKRWKIDNSNISTPWGDNNGVNNTIKVKYYSKNVYPIPWKDDSFYLKKIENGKYIIITLLRNNVIGYDKVKKKYFPIWVESCGRGCNKDIAFVGKDKLQITWEVNVAIIVDLNSMNFEIYKR